MSLYQFIYLFREREYVREKNRERERDGNPRVHVSDHHVPFQIRTLLITFRIKLGSQWREREREALIR